MEIVHYEDYAEECEGAYSVHTSGYPPFVTCPECLERMKKERVIDDLPDR